MTTKQAPQQKLRFTDMTPFDQRELELFRVDQMTDEEVETKLRSLGVDPKAVGERVSGTIKRALARHRSSNKK